MLRVKKITLVNFGPYKGTQTMQFPESDGVVVIFGENGRGKTSLLNAVRFAFFDKVLGRGTRELPLPKLLNIEAKNEGVAEFSVVLNFDFEGKQYELSRICKVSASGAANTDSFLSVNGNLLAQDDVKRALGKIMPEKVSRFFLFDGELLQEYEQLVLDSEDTDGIKEAIEKILGVPILTNAAEHLSAEKKRAEGAEAKALQRNRMTENLGKALAELQQQHDLIEREIHENDMELGDKRIQKFEIESKLKDNERISQILTKRKMLEDQKAQMEVEHKGYLDAIKRHSSDLWTIAVQSKVQDRIRSLRQQEQQIFPEIEKGFFTTFRKQMAEISAEQGICALCESPLESEQRKRLSLAVSDESLRGGMISFDRLQDIKSRLNLLEGVLDRTDAGALNRALMNANSVLPKIQSVKSEIESLDSGIQGIDVAGMNQLKFRHEKIIRELVLLDKTNSEKKVSLKVKENEILGVRKKLVDTSSSGESAEARRRVVCEQIFSVFRDAIDTYRNKLRSKVEKDASDLFANFSSDKDYEKLQINESYGLTIVHKDGQTVPLRSAGFEHIVALSLMGALQRNAPLRGPIFMDSPMGRLDDSHKENVTKGLSLLSSQVTLLVYKAEMTKESAEKLLGSKLARKFQLVKITSRHTQIQEI